MSNLTETWYEFVLQQMASESYLESVNLSIENDVKDALRRGNNREGFIANGFTRFTDVQAEEFWSTYQIIAQASDYPDPERAGPMYYPGTTILANTGLSATLIQKRGTNEFTLAIRSTEFKKVIDGGDRDRDVWGADVFGIVQYGFALAQLSALEDYYAWLKQSGNLPSGAVLNVTGYSLGGHLATVFTEIHANDTGVSLNHTYTFNGAGRGTWDQNANDPAAIVAYYKAVLFDPDIAASFVVGLPVSDPRYVDYALAKAAAVAGEPFDPLSLYNDPRHAWAQRAAGLQFDLHGVGLVDQGSTDLRNGAAAKITQIYGREFPFESTGVANSGVHGPAIGMFVEAQPLIEYKPDTATGATDFGNAHALVLIADSVAVMRLYQTLDTTATLDLLNRLFSAASNQRVESGIDSKAESDPLENMLDALRRLFLGSDVTPTEYKPGGSGFGDFDSRNGFYDNIAQLASSTQFAAIAGQGRIAELAPLLAVELAAAAQEDVAYRYALKNLNPFVVTDLSGQLAVYSDPAFAKFDRDSAPGGLSSDYIADRSAMLAHLLVRNANNLGDAFPSNQVTAQVRYTDLVKHSDGTITDFLVYLPGGTPNFFGPNTRRVSFGTGGAESLQGRDNVDHLYGGAGTDVLAGKRDNDTLEGGTGLDVYDYTATTSVGFFNTNDGDDTIRDTDGKGVLRYTYTQSDLLSSTVTNTVIADASDPQLDGTWRSADGKFTYAKVQNAEGHVDLVVTINGDAGGSLTLKDFRDGDFAIRPRGSVTAPQDPVRTFYGDKENWDSDPNQDGIQLAPDGFGNYIRADGQDGRNDIPLVDRVDEFYGSTADEVERFTTAGGNDTVFADGATGATGGPDLIETGAGRDIVWAGPGNDFIEGGSDGESIEVVNGQTVTVVGGDVVNAGAGDDALYGLTRIELATAIRNSETDVSANQKGDFLSAWDGNDRLIGATENDALLGGAGEDVLVGGAGDDNLWGDLAHGANTLAWTATRSVTPQGELLLYQIQLQNVLEAPISEGSADALYGGAGVDWSFGGGGDDFIDAGSGDDVSFGEAGADILVGGVGNDFLVGDNGPGGTNEGGDYLDGGAGNDTLQGDGGDDVLVGGPGEDVLMGGAGKDIYVFSKGDGIETVQDTSANDPNNVADRSIVVAGDGINAADVKFRPGSLTVDFGSGDAIHFQGFDQFNPANSPLIDEIRFADGSSISYAGILAQGFDVDGTEENDDGADADHPQLVGTGVVDRIRGYGGDDLLVGLAGDDVLDGGDGIDELQGGDGNDSLAAGAGDDLLFGEAGADTLSGGDGNDALVGGDGANVLAGDADADSIWGGTGDDTLSGGPSDDVLQGDTGNDAYLFSRGDGLDLVFDQDATAGNVDRVEFAADITPDDVTATRGPVYANDLVLTINGGAGELTIANQFSTDTSWQVEEIRFADGTVWTPASTPMLIRGNSSNNSLVGTSGPDVFEGLVGNDTLTGGAGDDVYRFYRGDGQDTITDNDSTAGNVDKVLFASDILPSDVKATRSGNNNLVLTLNGTSDRVTVTNHFQNDGVTPYSVEQIKFLADGTIWDLNTVKQMVLTGTSGNDTIRGFASDDVLSGLGGDDTLIGNAGNDTLDGGTGNDVLRGGFEASNAPAGNDTYLIARGDGRDTIVDPDISAGNIDRLVYASDILPSDVRASRSGDDLVLAVTGTTDQVTVTGYIDDDYAVEHIEFLADGTIWDVQTVKLMLLTGTSGNDSITGYATYDVLTGLGGDDTLTGNAGNDTLDGGAGNDSMQGGTGNDTYRIFRGDGQDTITDSDSTAGNVDKLVYAADILPSEIKTSRSGNNLVLSLNGTTDQVTITNYLENDGATPYLVERIEFQSDATVWDLNTVKTMLVTPTNGDDTIVGYATNDILNGLAGNDTIHGAGGDDTLDGGAGNDTLYGEGASDTYLFARGSGQETIINAGSDESGTTDVLLFASDIAPSQVSVSRSGNDLVLSITGTSDQVSLRDYFLGGTAITEEIRFSDGTVWTESYIATLFPVNGTSGNDNLQGSGLSETINALAGADTVRGGNGNDTIDGGSGADTLYGDAGDDVLIAGAETGKNAPGNTLYGGGWGIDILMGASGGDRMEDIDFAGNNLFSGGGAADTIRTGRQNDLIIGGADADSVTGNRAIDGKDVFLFNKADGKDVVVDLGDGSTVSVGGGALYSNLKLQVSGLNLILNVGTSAITLVDWYRQLTVGVPPYARISTLQVVIDGTRNYDPTSSDPMKNQKVQVFDFFGLVQAFDAARAAGKNFNVASNLANFRLWSSDTQAIGGAVAYQYARTGSIGALSYDQMRAVISAPEFAVAAQPISVSVSASDSLIQESPAAQEMSLTASPEAPVVDEADTETLLLSSEVGVEETNPGAATVSAMIEDLSTAGAEGESRSSTIHTPDAYAPLQSPIVMPASGHAPSPLAGSGAEHAAATQTAATGQLRASAASLDSGTALQWDQPGGALLPSPAGPAESEDGVSSHAASETPRASGLDLRFAALLDGWLARALYEQSIALSDFDEVRAGVTGNTRSARDAFSNAAAWNRVARKLPAHLEAYAESGFAAPPGFANFAFGAGLLGAASPVVAAIGLPDAGRERLRQFEGLREGIQLLA